MGPDLERQAERNDAVKHAGGYRPDRIIQMKLCSLQCRMAFLQVSAQHNSHLASLRAQTTKALTML